MVDFSKSQVYNLCITRVLSFPYSIRKYRYIAVALKFKEGIFVPTINREKVIQTFNRDLKKMDDAELRAISLVSHHIVKDKWRLKLEKETKEPKSEE